jgi:hypothetical protein
MILAHVSAGAEVSYWHTQTRREPEGTVNFAASAHLDAISSLALDFRFFLLLEIESCLK